MAVSTDISVQKKLSFKEQLELKEIEKQMPKLEQKRAEILNELTTETEYEKIAVFSRDLENLEKTLQELEMRWLELQD